MMALSAGVRRIAPATSRAAGARFASEWLQGRPPAVDLDAGTLAAFYYKNVRQFETPTKEFVAGTGQRVKLSVQAFDRHVYAYARGMLEGLGLKKGHKVATWMAEGEVEQLVIQLAAGLAGAEVVAIDPAAPVDTLTRVLQEQGVRVLFVSSRYAGKDRSAELTDAFEPELTAPGVLAGEGYAPFESKRMRSLKFIVTTALEPFAHGVVRLKDLPVYGGGGDFGGQYAEDDIAIVQTWVDKAQTAVTYVDAEGRAGASISHAKALEGAAAAAAAMGLTRNDAVVVTAPLHAPGVYSAGPLAASSVTARLVVPSKAFDASAALAAITSQRATHIVAAPGQVEALAAALAKDAAAPEGKRKFNLASLKGGLVVGGSAPATLGSAALKPFKA